MNHRLSKHQFFNLATNANNADAEVLYRNTTNVLNKSVAQQPYYDATITTLVAVGGFKNDENNDCFWHPA